jgi:hypothetical protein
MADKIQGRLKWQVTILNPSGRKPKGMHFKTFNRLLKKHDVNVNKALIGHIKKILNIDCTIILTNQAGGEIIS